MEVHPQGSTRPQHTSPMENSSENNSIGRFDAWNVFVCEDVKKMMLIFEIVMLVHMDAHGCIWMHIGDQCGSMFLHVDHIGSMNGPHGRGDRAVICTHMDPY